MRRKTAFRPGARQKQPQRSISGERLLPRRKPAKKAPAGEKLLLLDEDEETKRPAEPMADNSRCHVCHANMVKEELAVTHARAMIGCRKMPRRLGRPHRRRVLDLGRERDSAGQDVPSSEGELLLRDLPRHEQGPGAEMPFPGDARKEGLHRLPR